MLFNHTLKRPIDETETDRVINYLIYKRNLVYVTYVIYFSIIYL